MSYVLVICVLGLFWSGWMYMRNEAVYVYRCRLLDSIQEASNLDPIDDWRWRYDEFGRVSYNEMMWKFWKPVDKFYATKPDRTFK